MTRDAAGDWPEDFALENGNYENPCGRCRRSFRGYKRRMLCRACALAGNLALPPSDALMKIVRIASAKTPKTWATLLRHAKLDRHTRVRTFGLLTNVKRQDGIWTYTLSPLGADVKRLRESRT